jgi:hypothetical protein
MATLLSLVAFAASPADHRAADTPSDVALYLAVPLLWLTGVALLIAYKLRSR